MITLKRSKQVIIITLFLSILGVCLVTPNLTEGKASITFNFEVEYSNKNIITPNSNGETIGIIVDPGLWAIGLLVQDPIIQYKKDLEDTGYQVLLNTTAIGTVQQIRTFLQSWYTTNGISGVALIGNLPYAQYYHPAVPSFPEETFICDLYLMDLDGNWVDNNPTDGIFDGHSAGAGDIYPEIYVGRIDATNRTLGSLTNDQDIVNLLNKITSYRHGGISRTHKAITYIDDDWQLWANGTYDNWPAWLDNAYSTRTDVHTPTNSTTAADWLTRMTQNYEWAHLCAHSGISPSLHYFGPGGVGEGTVTVGNIHSTQPTFNFYNLFCCHGADWTGTDCLATTYLYSSSYSIGVIGSTKTGGMLDGTSFYNSIGQNNTIGQALHDWFQGISGYNHGGYPLEWFYGMVLLGDPFLTTHCDFSVYVPTIISTTHPNEALWYADNQPNFNWSVPVDVNGIAGYYYIIDQNPNTIPTISTGKFTTINGTSVSSALTDGIWYLHVVTKDGAGNVGTTAGHYQINCDSTDPVITINTPEDNIELQPGLVEITWSVTETGSGYDYAEILVDGILQDTVTEPTLLYNLDLSDQGAFVVTIAVYDVSGLTSSDSITINVLSFFNPTIFYIIAGVGGGFIILVIVIVVVRKRKAREGCGKDDGKV